MATRWRQRLRWARIVFRSWLEGMLYWKSEEPFRKQGWIVRAVMALLFFLLVFPLYRRSSFYGTIGLLLFLFFLGLVNFGLKKLCES